MKPEHRHTGIAILAGIFLLLHGPFLNGGPAWRGITILTQPDGTHIEAVMQGDEHAHVLTTLDGHALTRGRDGWWYYARYDYFGSLLNTGERAGADGTPTYILTQSRDIPYDLIWRKGRILRRRTDQLRLRQEKGIRTRSENDSPLLRHGLIILAQFQDLSFLETNTRATFEELINGASPTSALSYFHDQWQGMYDFRFDITEIVTLPENYSYYGENDTDGADKRAAEMIIDACRAVDDAVDFSRYDNDGDGVVDNVFVFFAGPNESENAGDDFIWPHQWYIGGGAGITCTLDGVRIDNYACTSELMLDDNLRTYTTLASIGTFCHEYTHTFGIPDLYDTDNEGSGGFAETLWMSMGLMDAGNQNNRGYTPPNYCAIERWYFGMSEPLILTEGKHTLRPIQEEGAYYRIPTDDPDELFLLECRTQEGWDAYIGGSGLVVYHIDISRRDSGFSTTQNRNLNAFDRWDLNELNANPDHQCVDVIEPDPDARSKYQAARERYDYRTLYAMTPHAFWPFEDRRILTCDTSPALRFWSGEDCPMGLADITRNPDGSVTFTVFNALEEKAPGVTIDRQAVFQDASIIQWSSVNPAFTGPAVIRWGEADDAELKETEVQPYEAGKYAFVIEGLTPASAYKVQLFCRSGAIPGPVNSNASFTTKSAPKAGSYPYIYLKDVERRTDGSFPSGTKIPLRVYNAPEAEGVRWYFDGKLVTPEADGYYTLTRSGLLKAVIFLPEGSDVITKDITVK